MPAEKTTRSASIGSRVARTPARSPVPSSPSTSLGRGAGVHRQAELLDVPASVPPPASSTCTGHQPRRELDDVGLEAELAQRVRGLQPEQAAADRPRRPCAVGRRRPDRLEVLDGAVDEAAVAGRGPGTGGTNGAAPVASTSSSYAEHLAVGRADRPGLGVDADDRGAEPQPHPRVVVRARRAAGRAASAPTSKNEVSATRSYAGRGSSPTTTTS